MAEIEINSKLCLRTDISVNWQNANPVLLRGEIGVEEDTGRIKIGNGKSEWSALPYVMAGFTKEQILDVFFPINAVRTTVGNVNPSESLGGEWEQISAEEASALYYWKRKG